MTQRSGLVDPVEAILWGEMFGRVRNAGLLQEVATVLVAQCSLIQKSGGFGDEKDGSLPRAGGAQGHLRENLVAIFDDYLVRLRACLASSDGICPSSIRALRTFKAGLISREAALQVSQSMQAFLSGADISFALERAGLSSQEDVLRLLGAVQELSLLCRREGMSESISVVYWETLCTYLRALGAARSSAAESEEDVVERCRVAALPVLMLEETSLMVALSGTVMPEADAERIGDWMDFAADVLSRDRNNGHDGDEVDDGWIVEQVVRAVMRAWYRNEVVVRVDGGGTSKVHVLSSLVRCRVSGGSSVAAELARPLVDLASEFYRCDGEQLQGVNIIASEWCLASVVGQLAEICQSVPLAGKKVESLTRRIVSRCMNGELMLAAQGVTVGQALRCDEKLKAQAGLAGWGLPFEELTELQRSRVVLVNGLRALFAVEAQLEAVDEVWATHGSMTVWNDQGEVVGRVEGRWFDTNEGRRISAQDAARYVFLAGMLDREYERVAEALCTQLGEVPPDGETLFVCSALRLKDKTRAGLGAAMVAAFIEAVVRMVPRISNVAVSVEPSQYVFREWEGVPAPLLAEEFSSRSHLRRWCETKLCGAVSSRAATEHLQLLVLDAVVGKEEAATVGADLMLGWKAA